MPRNYNKFDINFIDICYVVINGIYDDVYGV